MQQKVACMCTHTHTNTYPPTRTEFPMNTENAYPHRASHMCHMCKCGWKFDCKCTEFECGMMCQPRSLFDTIYSCCSTASPDSFTYTLASFPGPDLLFVICSVQWSCGVKMSSARLHMYVAALAPQVQAQKARNTHRSLQLHLHTNLWKKTVPFYISSQDCPQTVCVDVNTLFKVFVGLNDQQ